MKYKSLIKQLLREGLTKDKDFSYKGYYCKIPYLEHRNAYGCSVYKDGKYMMGIKGWLPLEKAMAEAKNYIDKHSELTESIKLISKSDKGNRIFKMLKSAKFQHYDMPKGELSSFSYGEEDRKRLVSKLSKEDKKTYKEWLKTPEGEKSMKIWDEISKNWKDRFPDSKHNIVESVTKIDKYGDTLNVEKGWAGFNVMIPEFKTRVKDCMVDIITSENGISEKSFSEYDRVITDVAEFFKNNKLANNIINELEKSKSRPEYVAEKIYNEMFQSSKISNDINEAKKKKTEFEILKDNKVSLTDKERELVMNADAVWHFSQNNKPSPAVWKSKNPKTGKITYVTNTHRAYNTAPTLKGAITRYHKFIKGTA